MDNQIYLLPYNKHNKHTYMSTLNGYIYIYNSIPIITNRMPVSALCHQQVNSEYIIMQPHIESTHI